MNHFWSSLFIKAEISSIPLLLKCTNLYQISNFDILINMPSSKLFLLIRKRENNTLKKYHHALYSIFIGYTTPLNSFTLNFHLITCPSLEYQIFVRNNNRRSRQGCNGLRYVRAWWTEGNLVVEIMLFTCNLSYFAEKRFSEDYGELLHAIFRKLKWNFTLKLYTSIESWLVIFYNSSSVIGLINRKKMFFFHPKQPLPFKGLYAVCESKQLRILWDKDRRAEYSLSVLSFLI